MQGTYTATQVASDYARSWSGSRTISLLPASVQLVLVKRVLEVVISCVHTARHMNDSLASTCKNVCIHCGRRSVGYAEHVFKIWAVVASN